MSAIDKNACQVLRNKLNILFNENKELLKECGIDSLDFNFGNMRYDSSSIGVKLNINISGKKKWKDEIAEHNLKVWMNLNNISSKTNYNGDVLVGYNSRRPKYPVSYVTSTGRRMKTSEFFAKDRWSE